MKTIKIRGLLNDQSRCYGVACNQKAKCLRYKQIEKDWGKDIPLSYTNSLMDKNSGSCQMMIGID